MFIQIGARAGYAARGLIFTSIGTLALLAAAGGRKQAVGTKGALELLLTEPLGRAMLWFVAAGLLCFAIWRVIQSIYDTEDCGSDAKGILRRVAMLGGAVVNLVLCLLALSIVSGFRVVADEDTAARDWTAWLLAKPFGQGLTLLVGASIVITGLALFWKAAHGEFREQIAAGSEKRVWIVALGQFGYVTRGIVFALIGAFLVIAARNFSSGEAAGMSGALRALQHQPYGPLLLGFAGAGLCSYGAFEIIQSIVRRIDVDAIPKTLDFGD
jgi:cytochrome bd-type quinol oxidase subunit 2